MTATKATPSRRPLLRRVLDARAPLQEQLTRLELSQPWTTEINPATEEMEIIVHWTPRAALLRDHLHASIRLAGQIAANKFLSA